MSSAVGFLAIAFVLSILGGAALVYFTNRGRRLPDVSQKRSARSTKPVGPTLANRDPVSGVRVLGIDPDEPKRG
ncbi:MAG: hypothetical protein IH940_07055 [Acidobacteria bacterium]|nr:hypothetical protein [Acidobacteriota bacterium]